jgi:transposase
MNATSPIATGDLKTDGNSPLSTVPTNIDQRLAEIETERARLVALDEEKNRLLREKEIALAKRRQETLATLPGLLQVGSLNEVLDLIRNSGTVRPAASRTSGARIPESTRAQARQMLEAGTPVNKVAKALRIGEATVWLWKRSWGLTKTRTVKAAKTKPAKRRNAQPGALSETEHDRLIAELKEGKVPVAKLAKQYRRSRARIYQIANHLGIPTPSLRHAA